jgi:hypothetical protein
MDFLPMYYKLCIFYLWFINYIILLMVYESYIFIYFL